MTRCSSCGIPEGSGAIYLVAGQPLCGLCCAAYLRRVRALAFTQATDEGLWFHAETAPEAYLQEALRKLHVAAEDRPDVESVPKQLKKA